MINATVGSIIVGSIKFYDYILLWCSFTKAKNKFELVIDDHFKHEATCSRCYVGKI